MFNRVPIFATKNKDFYAARRQFINKLPYEVIHNLLLIKHNLYGNGLT